MSKISSSKKQDQSARHTAPGPSAAQQNNAADAETQSSSGECRSEITKVAMKAMSGDTAAMARIDGILAQFERPDRSTLARMTEMILINRISRAGATGALAAQVEAHMLRDRLGEREAQPLECLLIDRIVCCRLALYEADISLSAHRDDPSTVTLHEKRVDRAQKRYLAAIKTLAQVRHLRLPEIHLNVSNAMTEASVLDVIAAEISDQ